MTDSLGIGDLLESGLTGLDSITDSLIDSAPSAWRSRADRHGIAQTALESAPDRTRHPARKARRHRGADHRYSPVLYTHVPDAKYFGGVKRKRKISRNWYISSHTAQPATPPGEVPKVTSAARAVFRGFFRPRACFPPTMERPSLFLSGCIAGESGREDFPKKPERATRRCAFTTLRMRSPIRFSMN